MKRENSEYYQSIARKIRVDIIKAVYNAGSGHPGGSLSAADIITALYFGEMNIDPEKPQMKDRDKFVLSKGHAVPAQYAALGERGYYKVEDMPQDTPIWWSRWQWPLRPEEPTDL